MISVLWNKKIFEDLDIKNRLKINLIFCFVGRYSLYLFMV